MLLNKPSLQLSPIGREGRFVGKLTVTYPEFTLLIKIKISASLNRTDVQFAPTNRVLQRFQPEMPYSPVSALIFCNSANAALASA
ncbi:hypothetical protein SAMN02746062_00313 [Alysiella filiformis DSM 16848]|uniref:Uncharacterized protein n=1 Tax=Alysiella filiformis DSM 16848 TaxID=1120981 RepID=A0A286E3M3_9NEIS|nr:hypothetical protein SAMN02746062_00313 [Alysiella filiformis DSM 16848]